MDNIFELNVGTTPMTAPPATAQKGFVKAGDNPTEPGAWWFHMVTMELYNAIVAGGLTPDANAVNQVAAIISAILTKQTSLETAQTKLAAAGLPYGALVPWPGDTPPDGYIVAQGQTLARTGIGSYPKLTAAFLGGKLKVVTDAQWVGGLSGSYSSGDGSTTLRVPDGRAAFLRGLDSGLGVDSGRVLGSLQDGSNQDHYHGTGYFTDNTNDDWGAIERWWGDVGSYNLRTIWGDGGRRDSWSTVGGQYATGTTN